MRRLLDSPDNIVMPFDDDDFPRRFASNLDAAIVKCGRSTEKISKLARINKTTINNWRRAKLGEQGPTIGKLMQLAAALRCDVSYLLGETEEFRIAYGPAQLDEDELTKCMETVLERHGNEKTKRLAERVAFLYKRRMSMTRGDLTIMEIIDDSYTPEDTAP